MWPPSYSASLLIFCLIFQGTAVAADEINKSPRPELRPLMQSVKASLDSIMTLAHSDGFTDEKNAPIIKGHLENIVTNAKELRSHTDADKTALKFYGHSLNFTAMQAAKRFEKGEYQEAQFFSLQIVESCMGCHSALPSSNASTASKLFSFDKNPKTSKLEKARLLVATRQFDQALTIYEEILTAAAANMSNVIFLNPFLEYLTVSIRVRNNMVRPLKTLLRVIEKPTLPATVRHDITGWTRSLQGLIKPPNMKKPLLSAAIDTLKEGKALMEYPYDRAGLVHYLHASALLQQFLDGAPTQKESIAEAYYLLGTTELLTGRSYWLSLADPYFQAAIEEAPKTKIARSAFFALEQNLLLNAAVQDTGELEKESQERLNRLRKLAL